MKSYNILFIGICILSCSPGIPISMTPANEVTPEPITILENTEQINSFEELIKPYKGKVVYVDIWASWCGPCKGEFAFKDELRQYTYGKDIVTLFVSIDKRKDLKKWRKMIKRFKLGGRHILADPQLKHDLVDKFHNTEKVGRKILSIPNFVIVDRNGVIVEADANRPSDGKWLYQQLEKYL